MLPAIGRPGVRMRRGNVRRLPEHRLSRYVAVLAALWLAAGWVNVARGAGHAGAGYRFWSFQHHCYSDIIALHGDRYLGGGRPLPYVEDRIEYPPLLGLILWAPSFLGRGALLHFTVSYAFLAACLLVALWALARTTGAEPYWLGATPALVYYAGLNWDLFPIALLALAVLALERGRMAGAGTLAGAGVSAKVFPAVMVPAALGALAAGRTPGSSLMRFCGAGIAVTALVNVPLAIVAWDGWSWFFRFNAGRGAENSLWHALRIEPGPLLEVLSTAPLAVAAASGGWAAFQVARRGEDAGRAVRLATALALVVWVATNKIWSPQYALYGFLSGALAAAPLPAFLTLAAISVADFHLAFQVRALEWEPWFRDVVWHPGNVARSVAWLLLAAWMARRLWAEARGVEQETGRG